MTKSTGESGVSRLNEALRAARVEAAERTGVVVDLRDAEVARLEILNDALNPVFADVPGHVDLFDRAISQGDTPRLWIDVVAHVAMGRDKRTYRFVQDTRFGRIVIAESHDVPVMADAITQYVARRLVERARALATTSVVPAAAVRRRSSFWTFAFGFIVGAAALFGAALVAALRSF
jgi:hypothetical protein